MGRFANIVPRVGLLLAATLLLGADGDVDVPWPYGAPPTSLELAELLAGAVELFELERGEEFLEAEEEGEESYHVFVLQSDIDEGFWDLDQLFQFGDSTFEHAFRRLDGYGTTELPRLQRVHDGAFGGRDSFSCAGCHQQGGVNGAGSATATAFYNGDGDAIGSAVLRSPPAVLGVGFVQALGVDMTDRLQAMRDAAIAQAAADNTPVTIELATHEVDFGTLTANPDGSVDSSGIVGVDVDLEIKPFGWKGHTARLRRFAEEAARRHFGIQSHVLALRNRGSAEEAAELGDGPWFDPDDDGVERELEEGTLTAVATYMALLESPVVLPPSDPQLRLRWANGSRLFDNIGCADCHRRTLTLSHNKRIWYERADTTNGAVEIDLVQDGEQPRSTAHVQLFSDLKRHDMGASLADSNQGPTSIAPSEYITRPLWGLAESAPYLHDGRAATIPEAIVAHDGEGAEAAASFAVLSADERQDVHIFLLSLTRDPKLRIPR